MKAKILRNSFTADVLCSSAALPALATNVSISVHQLGVYGRITLGGPVPQAGWAAPQPVVVLPLQVVVEREPIYLHVPTAHSANSANWPRHCARYNACSQPVIFVRDSWVRERHTAYDRDRDGDGKRNSRDRRPNNPYVR